jgi:Na+-driven multidrug efflux pump
MISATGRQAVAAAPIADTDAAPPRAAELDSRTRALLRGAIVPTLLRLAWPNILVMLAQASTGLIETWWVSHLGTDALAGMALVFPVVMLMQMVSAGAMGGGISSAVARALGAGHRDEADALVMHAIVVNVALVAFFSIVMLVFGPSIYRALGGTDGELRTNICWCHWSSAWGRRWWLLWGPASAPAKNKERSALRWSAAPSPLRSARRSG